MAIGTAPSKTALGLIVAPSKEANSALPESRILIVSDEPTTGRLWALCVSELHCTPYVADSVEATLKIIEENPPDVIVIDVSASGMDGASASQSIRFHTVIPLLLLTASHNESDALEAYRFGVDEYITKPISPVLFIAKLKVWLGRSRTVKTSSLHSISAGGLNLNPRTHRITSAHGKGIHLSNLEFRLLFLLMNRPGEEISIDEILTQVWGPFQVGGSALVKNVIYRLRKKVEKDPVHPAHIKSIDGGYCFSV